MDRSSYKMIQDSHQMSSSIVLRVAAFVLVRTHLASALGKEYVCDFLGSERAVKDLDLVDHAIEAACEIHRG